MTWLAFAMITVCCFGLYGVLLHTGQGQIAPDPNARYKAFLWVGIAYFLVAVLAPSIILLSKGASFGAPPKGAMWSLAAGTAGAVGAFFILMAFGAKGTPAVVMSIVFAGAPIVNAIVAMLAHPPAGGFGAIRWPFYLGIILAAAGGALVTLYKPPRAKTHTAAPPPIVVEAEPDQPSS